ncbi:hypothetical protein NECAME_16018 [Necator americanus]|uniref:Uncharacterized protein n=1 Tax=Necator americanus TaxID=51031 RepID=W2U0X9_NECAM|nr:hypothetical protein NECAME_16018 [Necator americanus]ETN86967.1 hypothetical protein NECAME_16018 [Necator americanus]
MSCSWLFLVTTALSVLATLADIDYALDCDTGYRVSGIKRTKTFYSVLGSLTIECEQISRPDYTTCAKQPSIPKCNGQIEGYLFFPPFFSSHLFSFYFVFGNNRNQITATHFALSVRLVASGRSSAV